MSDTLFPLTLTERRFWLWEHLFSGARVANLGVRVDVLGDIDVDAYRAAFAATALAPALRARIVERDGEFWGRIGDPGTLEVVEHATDADVVRACEDVVRAPFAHGKDALLRGRLLRLGKTKSTLVIGTHHAMVDGWSFASALPRAFGAALRGQPPSWDVERWLADRAASPPPDPNKVAADRAFWAERLKDTNALPYPTPKTPPAVASGRGLEAFVPLPRALLERVDEFASSLGARPVHVWLALVMAEVARATGSKDVLTATTSANRAVAKDADGTDERSIGCTMKSNLLFARLTKDTSFADVVAAARGAVREGLAHPDFVLEDLGQLGEDAPSVSTLLNYLPVKAWDDDLDGAVVHSERVFHGGTGTRTAFSVNAADTTPQLLVHLDADVFADVAAERMGRRLLGILDAALSDPSQPFTRLPRLVDDDRAAMARAQGTPQSRVPVTGGTLDVLFERDFDVDDAVKPRPALVHDERVIGRRELLRRGRHLARHLVAKGVGPGRYVVFQLHDPLLVMQAIVGVVFAGGAWVPTDITSPAARFASIVEACDAALVLTDDDVRTMLDAPVDDAIVLPKPGPRDPVYAIFTSGSTGKPKGVILSHDAVVAQLQGRHGLGFPHVLSYLTFAPFYFDGCIEPLLWTLTTGGTLHLLDENQRKDPALVRRLLRERKITNTSAVPTLWSAVLESDTHPLVDLKFVIVGGEALTAPLVKKHKEQAPHARFVNEYGPTESTVYSTAWDVPLDPLPTTILIGTSAPHVTCHVLDNDDQPAPAGEPGELVVSGRGVADGYLKMPEQTAKVFVRDLCVRGETAYRTGDVVRLHDDGNMEWLARKDDQVKVRGVRIELGEVEAGLALLPGVLEVAAVVRGGRLIGYIAPAVHTESQALSLLADKLPVTMMPSAVVALPVLPKSGSDKIDKKKLPEPQVTVEDVVPPRAGLESTIATIWSDVLGVAPISVTRSFFAYGGHSLKAAIVVARLKQATGRDVPLSSLMTARTVRALAELLEPSSSSSAGASSSSSEDPAVRLVIPLQEPSQHAPGPVVVFLPGIGGHVFTFTAIAERLRHRAVGLRAWGAERGEVPFGSLQGMAQKNLDALAAAGITDFALAGYSMGARVAFEMAVQMSAAGKKPARLFLFDAMAPGYPKKLPAWQRAWLHASTFLRADVAGKIDYVKDRAISIRNKRAFARGDAAAFVDEMPDVDPATRPLLEKLWGTAALANEAWWPARALDVPTTLFTASTPIQWVGHKMDDPLLGWSDWLKRPIDNVVLEGLHLELFEAKNHARIAGAIDAALDD
jgi:amino acid adenylation domain-containing protein